MKPDKDQDTAHIISSLLDLIFVTFHLNTVILTKLGWRQPGLQPSVGCEHLIHMIIKEAGRLPTLTHNHSAWQWSGFEHGTQQSASPWSNYVYTRFLILLSLFWIISQLVSIIWGYLNMLPQGSYKFITSLVTMVVIMKKFRIMFGEFFPIFIFFWLSKPIWIPSLC